MFFYPEEGRNTFLRNFSKFLLYYTTSHGLIWLKIRDQWRALVNTVMNLNGGEFLSD
jgi:hypothetical protein